MVALTIAGRVTRLHGGMDSSILRRLAANATIVKAVVRRDAFHRRRILKRSLQIASTISSMHEQLAVAVTTITQCLYRQTQPTADALDTTLRALRAVDAMMNDLQSPARLASVLPRMYPVDICSLVLSETTALEAIADNAEIALEIDVRAFDGIAGSTFVGDAVQLSQVIKNVLLNALKYTGRGGHVSMGCTRERGAVSLEISDDGPGVRTTERLSIFESGFRGSAAGMTAGSGVGLAVAHNIVQAHGGTIVVSDSCSGGARFVVRLPIASIALPDQRLVCS